MTATHLVRAEVGCELTFGLADPAELALHVAVAAPATAIEQEDLEVRVDGRAVEVDEVEEVAVERGGRVHRVRSAAGVLTVRYRAVVGWDGPPAGEPLRAADALVARRQSRYCPSDALEAFAPAELRDLPDGPDRARAIGSWVFERIAYELGSSGPLDTAIDTLLKGRGVCRDFAHLTVTLCRALGIPARFVAVYAPGLSPMDFHAVAEVAAAGTWEIVDATRLAPRPSLVRIATGRDAADTAFATTLAGSARLLGSSVTAVAQGDLPADDHAGPVALH